MGEEAAQFSKNHLYAELKSEERPKMKFLIITKMRPTSVDIWAKLLPAHFKYLDGLEKKKTVEVSYHLIGHQGDVLIVNADSDEQLASIVGEDPLFFYTDREI
jgi:uncharacterized protein YciI